MTSIFIAALLLLGGVPHVYICIYVVSLIFLFQKLDQSNTINILNRTDGLSRSAEKMNRVRKREREREGGRKRA